MTFEQMAKQRYSVRAFEKTPVEKEKLEAIVKVANSAPTATNAQPFHIGDGGRGWRASAKRPPTAWHQWRWCGRKAGQTGRGQRTGIITTGRRHWGAHIPFVAADLGACGGPMDPAVLISEFPEMEGTKCGNFADRLSAAARTQPTETVGKMVDFMNRKKSLLADGETGEGCSGKRMAKTGGLRKI
ncbi:MAG: nitroreductase family protein [Christensenellales bacterium]